MYKGVTLLGLGVVGLSHLFLERLYLLLERREDTLEVFFLLLRDLVALLFYDLLRNEAELLTQHLPLSLFGLRQFGQLSTKPFALLTHLCHIYAGLLRLPLALLQSRAEEACLFAQLGQPALCQRSLRTCRSQLPLYLVSCREGGVCQSVLADEKINQHHNDDQKDRDSHIPSHRTERGIRTG